MIHIFFRGLMEVSWRFHGGFMEVSWRFHGGFIVINGIYPPVN